MKLLLRRFLPLILSFASPLLAGPPAQPKAPAPALLPQGFADWKLSGPARTGTAAEAADSANAAVLKEDGMIRFAAATYREATPAAPSASVRAYQFPDATGAFAAFTFYRRPGMRAFHVGPERGPVSSDNAAAEGPHVLFWSGTTLVDCLLSKEDSASMAGLAALSDALPHVGGSSAIAPPLPTYLPGESFEAGSVRYSIGPAAYAATGNPVPAEVIDFGRDAEVVTGTYRLREGAASQVTLVMYPTPQLAVNRERALAAFAAGQNNGKGPGTGFEARRLGAMLAYTSGELSKAEADRLVGGIRYKTEVIINHPEGYVSEVAKAAKLLLGIGYLTGILGVGAVILAIFLGAGRVLVRKLRGKPISSMNDEDFISLKIDG